MCRDTWPLSEALFSMYKLATVLTILPARTICWDSWPLSEALFTMYKLATVLTILPARTICWDSWPLSEALFSMYKLATVLTILPARTICWDSWPLSEALFTMYEMVAVLSIHNAKNKIEMFHHWIRLFSIKNWLKYSPHIWRGSSGLWSRQTRTPSAQGWQSSEDLPCSENNNFITQSLYWTRNRTNHGDHPLKAWRYGREQKRKAASTE